MSKEMIFIVFILSLVLLIPAISQAQSNYSETLTITTYYPSPYGVYRNLEVKRSLAVGDITKGPLGSMDNLTSGQLYINNSLVLNSLPGTPAPAFSKAGQVIYVNNATSGERMLKFHDGNAWVNATAPPCPSGKQCYTSGSSESCPSTQICRPSNWTAPGTCPSDSITVYYYEPWSGAFTGCMGPWNCQIGQSSFPHFTSGSFSVTGSWSTIPPCVTHNPDCYYSGAKCASVYYKTGCLKITSDNTPPPPVNYD